MLSLKESLKILKETNALIEGHFILSSGLHSAKYIQCAQLMSKPEKAEKLCLSLAEKIKSDLPDFDLILSPAMGGILVAYELGKLLNKDNIFSERVNGEFQLRRGFKINKNSKVDSLVIAVGHKQFRELNLTELKSYCNGNTPILADLKSIFSKEKAILAGFDVFRL